MCKHTAFIVDLLLLSQSTSNVWPSPINNHFSITELMTNGFQVYSIHSHLMNNLIPCETKQNLQIGTWSVPSLNLLTLSIISLFTDPLLHLLSLIDTFKMPGPLSFLWIKVCLSCKYFLKNTANCFLEIPYARNTKGELILRPADRRKSTFTHGDSRKPHQGP